MERLCQSVPAKQVILLPKHILRGSYLCVNPKCGAQAEGILLALFSDIHVLVNAIVHLPGDSQVVFSFATWPNNHIPLVHGLHHLLSLLEANVVE